MAEIESSSKLGLEIPLSQPKREKQLPDTNKRGKPEEPDWQLGKPLWSLQFHPFDPLERSSSAPSRRLLRAHEPRLRLRLLRREPVASPPLLGRNCETPGGHAELLTLSLSTYGPQPNIWRFQQSMDQIMTSRVVFPEAKDFHGSRWITTRLQKLG